MVTSHSLGTGISVDDLSACDRRYRCGHRVLLARARRQSCLDGDHRFVPDDAGAYGLTISHSAFGVRNFSDLTSVMRPPDRTLVALALMSMIAERSPIRDRYLAIEAASSPSRPRW